MSNSGGIRTIDHSLISDRLLDSPQPAAVAMNCHLLVPNLFWPASAGAGPYLECALPGLEALFARGRREREAGCSMERWLARAFGLESGDELPLAPFALRADGVDPGPHWWIAADPVHLKVHGTRLILAEASRFPIAQREADELVAALNAHFAARDITFLAPRPHRWYARTARSAPARMSPSAEVAGMPVESFLPAGEAGACWRAIINEAQMLLHEHRCNAQREARGELTVNSVWLWGGGRAPVRTPAKPYGAVWADHPLAAGLAAASGAEVHALPASGAALVAGLAAAACDRVCLAVIDAPLATAYGDVQAWREAVLALEQRWLAPLLAAVHAGALDAITLHALGRDFGYRVAYTRRDRLRFWQIRRPLPAYIG
jgi:hypothetical protein